MSILTIIERLREKPREVRVQVSFLTAVCVTGVVALLWGATLPTRLDSVSGTEVAQDADEGEEMETFFNNARTNLGQVIESTRASEAAPPEPAPSSPSGAYEAGAPDGAAEYQPSGVDRREPAITPVDRREVLIGTTTSARE